MKKFFLASLFFLLLFKASAQLHIGAKAGANLTKINGESFKSKYRLGYQLGGYLYYDFSKTFGIQLEAQFNQSNTQVTDRYSDILFNTFDKGKKLNYITIPALLRINSQGGITLLAGAQFSFLADSDKNIIQNGKKLFNSTDIGLVAGLDINLRPFIISGRYIWGVTNVSSLGDKANNRQIQVGIAFEIF